MGTNGAVYIGGIEQSSLVTASRDVFTRDAVSGFEERFHGAYKRELSAFLDCVIKQRSPEIGITEGLRSLEIALAATESLRSRTPVTVVAAGP